MQVVMVAGGYLYGFAAAGPSCAAPLAAARLYDAIRRTDLGHYVRQKEEYRDGVVGASDGRGAARKKDEPPQKDLDMN